MGLNANVDLTSDQRGIILGLLRTHLPNVTVWAYGSRVRWNARPYSDLDLVAFTSPGQESQLANLKDAFEESTLPFEVDLLAWDDLPESFHRRIKQEYAVLQKHVPKAGRVENAWPRVSVSDIAATVIGGTPSREVAAYWRGDIPWATAKDVAGVSSRYLNEVQEFVTEKGLASSAAKQMPAGTVLITARGTVGALAQLRRAMAFNQTCYAIVPNDGFDNDFLFYALKGTLAELESLTYGTIFATITTRTFDNWLIPRPPLPEQRAIAHVLGTLDDKIELNRRMNETLEAMARALFKSWFIDFDPVHAKATLKQQAASEITPPLRGSRQAKGASPQARRWGGIRRGYTQRTLTTAQTLRRTRTDAEGLLWHYLRHNQLDGHRFRRQHPIGPYIVDFACLARKVLIELDGSQHAERQADDKKRDAFLRAQGYRVLRFWNNEIFENCFGVLERIYEAVTENPPPKPPAPDGLTAPTPPQGGSDWTVERARAYLDGMSPEIAALFPDRFVDSELGKIPEGWEISPLSEVIEINPPRCLQKGDIAPYLDMANMPTKGHTPDTMIDRPYASGMRFVNGDTLVARITPCLENGKTAYVDFLPDGVTGWGSTEYIVMRPKRLLPDEFAYCLARSASFREFAIQNMTGTSGRQRVPATALSQFLLPRPSKQTAKSFGDLVRPLIAQASEAVRESRTLTALRDMLLPKLISDKMRMSNVPMENNNVN